VLCLTGADLIVITHDVFEVDSDVVHIRLSLCGLRQARVAENVAAKKGKA